MGPETVPHINDAWPLIMGLRRGAERIVRAAYRFGVGLDELKRPDGHERGREWFPALADRLHLGAVIAKCGTFCTYAEAFVKNTMTRDPARHLKPKQLGPRETPDLVARYNRHLGLDLPQPAEPVHQRQRKQVREQPDPLRVQPIEPDQQAERPAPAPSRQRDRDND